MIPELAYEALVCRDKLRSHWQRRLVLDVARIKQIFAAWAQKKKHGEEPTVRASRGREAARGDAAVELAVVALAVAAQARRLARLPRVEPHRPRRRTWRRQRATTTTTTRTTTTRMTRAPPLSMLRRQTPRAEAVAAARVATASTSRRFCTQTATKAVMMTRGNMYDL